MSHIRLFRPAPMMMAPTYSRIFNRRDMEWGLWTDGGRKADGRRPWTVGRRLRADRGHGAQNSTGTKKGRLNHVWRARPGGKVYDYVVNQARS